MMPIMMPPTMARPGRAYSVDTAMLAGRQQEDGLNNYPPPFKGRSKIVTIDEDGNEGPGEVDDSTLQEELLECYDCQNEDYSVFDTGNKIATWKARGSRVVIRRTLRSSLQAASDVDREINILSKCTDPSIPLLIESLELKDVVWTVIEHRPTETIAELVKVNGPMSDVVLKSALNHLFSGIAALFMGGFAHLRITDETVCIDSNQQLMITDFHYTCEYQSGNEGLLYAMTQEKFGDDIYTAPEIFSNITYNARKATIWSCGVLIYFMVTGQTEKLSNLDHPSFESTKTNTRQTDPDSTPSRRRGSTISSITIINYPGSTRFEVPNYARWIIPKMLASDPLRRSELIECASRVPKEYSVKDTRMLMELAWLDYKQHVGPYGGWNLPEIRQYTGGDSWGVGSSASSIYSMASAMSNPFRSLLNRGDRRRKSMPVAAGAGMGPSGVRW